MPEASTVSDAPPHNQQKRPRSSAAEERRHDEYIHEAKTDDQSNEMTIEAGQEETAAAPGPSGKSQSVAKSKRVRTGCLTCRERHVKCDETLPSCSNCSKANRICKRGIRLKFIDTQIQAPPVVPPTQKWAVTFFDESRDIANGYEGGLSQYSALDAESVADTKHALALHFLSNQHASS